MGSWYPVNSFSYDGNAEMYSTINGNSDMDIESCDGGGVFYGEVRSTDLVGVYMGGNFMVEYSTDNAVSLKVITYIDDCMSSGAITSDLREATIQAFGDNGIPLNHRANTKVFVKESCVMDADAFRAGKDK